MKQYLLKLHNNQYVIMSSDYDYEIGDGYGDGIIIQKGIQLREYGQHFNVGKI